MSNLDHGSGHVWAWPCARHRAVDLHGACSYPFPPYGTPRSLPPPPPYPGLQPHLPQGKLTRP